jgi:hypothetical protein
MVSLQQRVYNTEWLDFDVLQNIMDNIPRNGTFHHIKGHQIMTATSSIEVRMNAYVDSLAKSAIKDPPKEFSLQMTIRLMGGDKPLFSTTNVVHFCQKQVSSDMWRSRFGELTFAAIDWNIFNQLCYNFKNQITIIKLFNEITPTRHQQHKIKQYPTNKCPLCQIKEEDYHHVLFCNKNPERLQFHCIKIEKKLKSFGNISEFVKNMIHHIEQKVTNIHDKHPDEHQVARDHTRENFKTIVIVNHTTHEKGKHPHQVYAQTYHFHCYSMEEDLDLQNSSA